MSEHWICLGIMFGLLSTSWKLFQQRRMQRVETMRQQRLREELEAYARLDVSMGNEVGGDAVASSRTSSKRICRTVADQSAFTRVAMLLRDAEGHMYCASSAGVDDLTVAALHAWGESIVAEERSKESQAVRTGAKVANNPKSVAIVLGEWAKFDPEVSAWAMAGNKERRRWRRGIAAPFRMQNGRLMGALVICADGERHERGNQKGYAQRIESGMGPIELLAGRIATSMESEAMRERLQRAEKLAGLGQLAGGVADALGQPLTAVLGLTELIVESSREDRVRKDAETMRGEALKMRDIVQRLTEFWQPAGVPDQPVEVVSMLHELEATLRTPLEEGGVELIMTPADEIPCVRGSSAKLKQVLEHLLNNSFRAITTAGKRTNEGHAIRVTVSHDDRAVQLIVSDTGTGFEEPARVFDPFYTTREPGEGAGLGLSICYGIVRDHGGEISAYNLHPHGASVIVELPIAQMARDEGKFMEMKVA